MIQRFRNNDKIISRYKKLLRKYKNESNDRFGRETERRDRVEKKLRDQNKYLDKMCIQFQDECLKMRDEYHKFIEDRVRIETKSALVSSTVDSIMGNEMKKYAIVNNDIQNVITDLTQSINKSKKRQSNFKVINQVG